MAELSPLRPHQVASLDQLRSALRDGARRPMLQLPTGAGKTVIAAHIVAGARAKRKRVAFCVPALGLVDQTFHRFVENGLPAVEMGVLQGDHPWRRPHAPVQIATAQTLARREIPEVDLAIIDEAHVRFGIYDRWVASCPQTLFVGLTATPWARGLGKIFDRLIKPTSIAELIEAGFLSPFRVFAPSSPDLSGCRTLAGDYHEGDLGEIMGKPKLVADIVETWLLRGRGLPTLCFAVNRKHARMIHDQFAEVGVRVAYIDAETPRETRDDIGRQLGRGEVQVVCNIGTLTTGIDWDVRCLILARPTRSEMLFVQIIGRGLRTGDGKADCLILDHSDTHQRLGMVTDIDHDELDDGRKRAAKATRKAEDGDLPLPRCCPTCTALMPATERLCGSCGSELPSPDPVVEVDGRLIELGKGGRDDGQTVVDRLKRQERPHVFAQFSAMAVQRGYSAKWPVAQFHEVFGSWPPRDWAGREAEPTSEVLAYVRAKSREFAKRKRAEAEAAGQESSHVAA